MRAFSQLFQNLDATNSTREKVALLEEYFATVPAEDAAWALFFLYGRKVKRTVTVSQLQQWCSEACGLPKWLVEECYDTVGDLAETMALILPEPEEEMDWSLSCLVQEKIETLPAITDQGRREVVRGLWRTLPVRQRFLLHKFLTGGFRVGVSRLLIVRAMAGVADVAASVMAHRLMGSWSPSREGWERLLQAQSGQDEPALPYPFFLASPLEEAPEALGNVADWLVEWKWDGIRVQLIRRQNQTVIWTRGEEMIATAFPEISWAGSWLADGTVLDGELVVWGRDKPAPFGSLQRRLGRKSISKAMLKEYPAVFLAYDLLEWEGRDWRSQPLVKRRAQLKMLMNEVVQTLEQRHESGRNHDGQWTQIEMFDGTAPSGSISKVSQQVTPLRYSEALEVSSWTEVAAWQELARQEGTEGVMLKRSDSLYGVGRQRGGWWKWKVDPYVIDAVLVAAQKGHGRRANLYTDYTFALWSGGELVTVAKAYSGLTDAEFKEVDGFIRKNIIERHGPVRSVTAQLVFELAFEGIQESGRHKSGLALRFPRMARWRRDKQAQEADTVEILHRLQDLNCAHL